MKVFKLMNLTLVLFLSIVSSCSDQEQIHPQRISSNTNHGTVNARTAGSFYEDFESGSKTSYSAASVTLSTGSWYLSDALIGVSSSDAKTGFQSVRIRNTGIVSMNFNVTTGASMVNVKHATYGSDGSSSWELWMTTNNGATYSQVGSTVNTTSSTLSDASFELNVSGNVSFEIRKVSGGTYRINIDEFEVLPYVEPAPAPVPAGDAMFEDFESASKTSYAGGSVAFVTGSWFLSDALVGTSSSDRKNGTKSVRIRNNGALSMEFDVTSASMVNIQHAVYGSDGSSSWELWQSTNGGSTYSKVGSTISSTSTTLSIESFAVEIQSAVRFEIRKVSGGSYRLNIDDFEVVPYSRRGDGDQGRQIGA